MNSFTFPTVLAGPILRRVEASQICIWIATNSRYHIKAKLYNMNEDESDTILSSNCETNTIRMGKNLYIHLLKLSPDHHLFPVNQLLGYNIYFKNKHNTFDLQDLGMLSPENSQSIVYGHLKYPSFYIHHSDDPSNLLYGSCRKLHGEGDDTLSHADQLIEKNASRLKKRPHSLFLLGDQIYADDVADSIIQTISTIGAKLIGQKEDLVAIEKRLENQPFKTSIKQINGRQRIIEDFCQFTSSSADNHLIELGEYATMYLLSWSPALWEEAENHNLFESFDDAIAHNHVHFADTMNQLEKKQLKKRYTNQQERLKSFKLSLFRVRRLFANIPTYMMFDDHDITDDWNIASRWKQKVRASPLGKHVVANGLSAYWAFQGWGNQPDTFDKPFITTMKKYFKCLRNNKLMKHHHTWSELLWNYNQWHFIAPTIPKAVFLDTRTQRTYNLPPRTAKLTNQTKESTQAPQLVSQAEWADVTKKLMNSNWTRQSPLIVVSAVPFYGIELIEYFFKNYVHPLRGLGLNVHTTFDLEAWRYNSKGFTSFLQHVAGWTPNPCIILSGDAHLASSVHSNVTFPDGKELTIKQFTSSPSKNESFTGLLGTLVKGGIEANRLLHKDENIQRYCDLSYRIQHLEDKDRLFNQPYVWKDQLTYQPVNDESIIETDNNLGLLTISSQFIENSLLK